jgi:peptidase E
MPVAARDHEHVLGTVYLGASWAGAGLGCRSISRNCGNDFPDSNKRRQRATGL